MMYISHDEILGALYKALGWNQVKGALPATAIYIEFYKVSQSKTQQQERLLDVLDETSSIRVRAFFNESADLDGEILPIN